MSAPGHLPFVPVRHPTHRWWAGAAVTLLLSACAQASAEGPRTEVAGARLVRQEPSEQSTSVFDPASAYLTAESAEPSNISRIAPADADQRATGLSAASTAATAVVPFDPPPLPTTPIGRPASEKIVTTTVGGVERQWTLVVPPNTSESQRLPLLIVLHGVGGKGAAMRRLGFEKFASPAGYMVAYPDAVGGSWNDGRPGMEPLAGTPVDDVAFLRELIARSVADAGADAKRIAIAGFSNGALMASRAACDMTDQLASVVLVSGSGPRDMTAKCKPSRPLPMMVVFGTADTVVPYEGGPVAMYAGKPRGLVAPVREVLDIWRGVNGCTGTESQPLAGTSPSITAMRGTGCRADVVHLKVAGGTHDWVTNATFDTTTEAWKFVAAHLA